MVETLTLEKALELYDILGKYIPDPEDNVDVLEFIGKIISNMNSSGDNLAYSLSLELMSGKTLQELDELGSDGRLALFTECLSNNQVLSLKSFCKNIGYSNG